MVGKATQERQDRGTTNSVPTQRGTRERQQSSDSGDDRRLGLESTAQVLPVRSGEAAWSPAELEAVAGDLRAEAERLRSEISTADTTFSTLLWAPGDGAGDDQADAGSRTFEREHEMSLNANARDLLEQVERAFSRIADGTYGICEKCSNPIGKARLQAYPRATLCVACKQLEERR